MFIINQEVIKKLQAIESKQKEDIREVQDEYEKAMQMIRNEYEHNVNEVLLPCVQAFIRQADNKTLYKAIINSICSDVIWQHTIIDIDSKHPELGDNGKKVFDIDDNWYNLYYLHMLTDELASNRGEEGRQLSKKLEPLYIRYGQGTISKEKAEQIIKKEPERMVIID